MKEMHGPWLAVPYGGGLRTTLKQRYSICAQKEMAAVGVAER
jgi:hypothetical protein